MENIQQLEAATALLQGLNKNKSAEKTTEPSTKKKCHIVRQAPVRMISSPEVDKYKKPIDPDEAEFIIIKAKSKKAAASTKTQETDQQI